MMIGLVVMLFCLCLWIVGIVSCFIGVGVGLV